MSKMVKTYAQREAERIELLVAKNAAEPVVTFDGKTYTITIFRKDGTWLNNFFTEHNLSVGKAHKDEFQGRTLAPQIKGPPADDGFFYYLYAQPQNVGHPTFIWLESKEEAAAVAKAIQEAEDDQR